VCIARPKCDLAALDPRSVVLARLRARPIRFRIDTGVFLGALGPLLAEPADALFHEVAATRKLDPRRGLVPVD
jgi:hypothetical protein